MTRRLLLAAGGGSFTLPAVTTATELAAAPLGGWTQTQGPHGVYHANYGYFTGVNGSSDGSLEVGGVNLNTGVAFTPVVIHGAFTNDTHDAGSLLVRASDNRLMAVYSGHTTSTLYVRFSVNSLDSDPTLSGGFSAETNIDASVGGTEYTYPYLGQLNDGSLWIAFRDYDGVNTYHSFTKSTDDGATWSALTHMWFKVGQVSTYWFVAYDGGDIHMAISTGNGVTGTHVSLYYARRDITGGNPYKSDGTMIAGGQPLAVTTGTLVHDGSAYPNAWPSGMTVDDTSAPVMLYETVDTANGHSYGIVYARFSGGTWNKTTVTTFSDAALVLIAHSALEEGAARVFTVEPVSGVWELFEYVTTDHGATFTSRQVTSGSASPGYVYPSNVADPDPRFRAVVLAGGSYVDTSTFNIGTYRVGS